jgi:hypothetical protein
MIPLSDIVPIPCQHDLMSQFAVAQRDPQSYVLTCVLRRPITGINPWITYMLDVLKSRSRSRVRVRGFKFCGTFQIMDPRISPDRLSP